jgi:uncharacterized membrane protein YhaH (DUF805 family)
MIDSYTSTIAVLLVAVFVPSVTLAVMLRPRRLKDILRGGEVAAWWAFSIDTASRLLLIGTGSPVYFPGPVMATITLGLRAIVAMLIWGRVSQVARHRLKNKEAQRISIEYLRDLGEDVSALENQMKGKKK